MGKNFNQGYIVTSEYDEKDDVVRVKVKPKKNNHTERLQYFVETAKGNDGKISMAWERIKIEFEIKFIK